MANLEFKPYLPEQEKPELFEKFRILISDRLNDVEGDISFQYIEALKKFDIISNELKLNQTEFNKLIKEIDEYLI